LHLAGQTQLALNEYIGFRCSDLAHVID
jgi:hypothetical protein